MRTYKVLFGSFLLILILIVGFHSNTAHAAVGDMQVIVDEEGDSAPLSGATVLFRCAGGAFTALTGNITTNGSGVVHAAPQAGSDCQNGESVDLQISKTGYITQTIIATNTYNTGIDNIYGAAVLQFAFKLIVGDELGNAVTPTVATLRGSGATYSNTNTLYFADSSASSGALVVQKDGYVSSDTVNTSGVTTSTVAQVVVTMSGSGSACTTLPISSSTSCKGLQYALKVSPLANGGGALTGATVIAGNNGSITCAESSGIYYCAIPLAHTGTVATVYKNPTYVPLNITYTDRTAVTDPQVSVTGSPVLTSTAATTVTTSGGGHPIPPMYSNPSPVSTDAGSVATSSGGTLTITSVSNTQFTITTLTSDVNGKSSKASIMNAQRALNKALGGSLTEDGKWGPKTIATVKAFQKWANIKQVANIGPVTRAKLNEIIK